MKRTITNSLAALLLLSIGVMGCSKEETLPDTPNTARTPMTIRVTDGGYAASDKSTADSRAMENGYATEFTAGDRIGLYVVKSDGSYAHENIALTLTDSGDGKLVWTPSVGTYYDATANYFAYYPYQSVLVGDLVPLATDAAGFFTHVVSEWAPATDQNSYALYTAQDLMVSSGTASKQVDGTCLLALPMTHAMALVVIETPATKYTLSSDANYTWTAAAPDTKFDGFMPYSPTGGTYRYLVKPAQSGATDLYGSYTAASGNTQEYIIKQNNIAAANYAHYKVDGGTSTIIEKTHTLQAGDFYQKDGSLLGKNETPTTEQKATCIGIVYWVGDPTNTTNGDPLLTTQHSGCTHGLVVALQNAGSNSRWSSSYEYIYYSWFENQTGYGITSLREENKIQGYANTQALIDYNTTSSNVQNNSNLKVLPIEAITTTYASAHPTPASSSGWYFPSIIELQYMCSGQGNSSGTAGRDFLNAQLGKVSGASLQLGYYWSSTESNDNWACAGDFYRGRLNDSNKNSSSYVVRAVAAF